MFSIVLYLSLPFVFLFHEIEEIAKRKRWARVNIDRIGGMYPSMRPMLVHLRDMSNKSFCIIVAEELLFISLAVISVIYGVLMAPLFALTWAFSIHLMVHIAQTIAIKGYAPGLMTSILLLPYAGIAIADMLQQFAWQQNLLYAVLGTMAIVLNSILMHKVFYK